ncbi:MAG: hypothetical protein ACKO7B_01365, partial [Flavobacteriales bacterium]
LQRQRLMLIMDALHIVMIYAGFHVGMNYGGSANAALWGFTFAQVAFYLMAIGLAVIFIKTSKLLHDERN